MSGWRMDSNLTWFICCWLADTSWSAAKRGACVEALVSVYIVLGRCSFHPVFIKYCRITTTTYGAITSKTFWSRCIGQVIGQPWHHIVTPSSPLTTGEGSRRRSVCGLPPAVTSLGWTTSRGTGLGRRKKSWECERRCFCGRNCTSGVAVDRRWVRYTFIVFTYTFINW